jgi:hypothetical protein
MVIYTAFEKTNFFGKTKDQNFFEKSRKIEIKSNITNELREIKAFCEKTLKFSS